ncbi:Mitochondrial import receptor subunit TOM22-like protein [Aphelenchoides bicaudatus]|nr:Mitochondrial import receptor subunit TOM22-like protein [Aphelenchoides bicaudatus]
MTPPAIDWDLVPDDELNETYWERIEALKEIFPASLRQKVSGTVDWSCWLTKKTYSFTKSALWVGSTSAIIMVLPVIIEKELAEMAKSQTYIQMIASRLSIGRLINCSARKCIHVAGCSSVVKSDEPTSDDKKAIRTAERQSIKVAMAERKKKFEELDVFSTKLLKEASRLPDDDELREVLGSSLIRDPKNKKSVEQMQDEYDRTGREINKFRKIIYDEGELDNSDLSKPPSRTNPHPFDPSTLPPTHARSLMAYVNHLPVLRRLVDIGVDLFELDLKPKLGQKLLRLDLMSDVKPRIAFLARDIGVDLEDIGPYLTRNPYFLLQPMDDIRARFNYLRDKKFNREQIKKIVIANRYWLNMDVKSVDSRLGFFQKQFQLTGDALRNLLTKEPRLIIFGTGPIRRLLFLFNNDLEFDPAEIKKMLIDDPRLFMMDPHLITASHNYLHTTMKISNELIVEYPAALRCPIADIQKRHLFLKKLNMDQYQPELPNYIPLKKILHPSDRYFSETLCKKFLHDYDNYLKTL